MGKISPTEDQTELVQVNILKLCPGFYLSDRNLSPSSKCEKKKENYDNCSKPLIELGRETFPNFKLLEEKKQSFRKPDLDGNPGYMVLPPERTMCL